MTTYAGSTSATPRMRARWTSCAVSIDDICVVVSRCVRARCMRRERRGNLTYLVGEGIAAWPEPAKSPGVDNPVHDTRDGSERGYPVTRVRLLCCSH